MTIPECRLERHGAGLLERQAANRQTSPLKLQVCAHAARQSSQMPLRKDDGSAELARDVVLRDNFRSAPPVRIEREVEFLTMSRVCRPVRFSTLDQQFRRLASQGLGDLTEHGDARRHIGALDSTYVARTKAGSVGKFFLRQPSVMTDSTQIYRHDLFEVHGQDQP